MELFGLRDWRIKTYSIAYKRDAARPELVARAKELAVKVFPDPGLGQGRYGVGFLGIHHRSPESSDFNEALKSELSGLANAVQRACAGGGSGGARAPT